MSYYSDPTANAAMGAVDKELNAKRKLAKQIARQYHEGWLSLRELEQARKEFRGLSRNFLRDALEKTQGTGSLSDVLAPGSEGGQTRKKRASS